jgi:hypothetical protein
MSAHTETAEIGFQTELAGSSARRRDRENGAFFDNFPLRPRIRSPMGDPNGASILDLDRPYAAEFRGKRATVKKTRAFHRPVKRVR